MVTMWKTDERATAVYGSEKTVEFAVPCPMCNGGHDEHVRTCIEMASVPGKNVNAKLSEFDWNIYKDKNDSQIDCSKQKWIVQEFVKHFTEWEKKGLGLYIYSRTRGSGKTFLASCICNELITKYAIQTRFVSESELVALGINKNDEYGPHDQIKQFCECRLLVLDDLGQRSKTSGYLGDLLFRILKARNDNGRVSIVTSNIDLKELDIDDRVTSRLNDDCSPLPLPEYSVRSQKGKEKQKELFKHLIELEKGAS